MKVTGYGAPPSAHHVVCCAMQCSVGAYVSALAHKLRYCSCCTYHMESYIDVNVSVFLRKLHTLMSSARPRSEPPACSILMLEYGALLVACACHRIHVHTQPRLTCLLCLCLQRQTSRTCPYGSTESSGTRLTGNVMRGDGGGIGRVGLRPLHRTCSTSRTCCFEAVQPRSCCCAGCCS